MKKLSILALALVASSAFAVTPTDVVINSTSIQAAFFDGTSVANKVSGRDNIGQQNLASNAGDITINGAGQLQVVAARDGSIWNTVSGRDNVGSQNLSSNVGIVKVNGTSVQITASDNSYISNTVSGRDNVGTQNIASNNSCATCVK
jgi:hypothetical protein